MVYCCDRQDEIGGEIRTEWKQAQQAKSQASPSPYLRADEGKKTLISGEVYSTLP